MEVHIIQTLCQWSDGTETPLCGGPVDYESQNYASVVTYQTDEGNGFTVLDPDERWCPCCTALVDALVQAQVLAKPYKKAFDGGPQKW